MAAPRSSSIQPTPRRSSRPIALWAKSVSRNTPIAAAAPTSIQPTVNTSRTDRSLITAIKTSSLLFHIVATTLVCCGVRAQTNSLEDRPFEPSASVVKGTVAALADSSDEVAALAVRALADWRQASVAPDIAKLLVPAAPEAVRMEAFQFFARLGTQAKPHVAEVLKICRRPGPEHSRFRPCCRLRRAGVRRKCGSDLATTQRLAQRRSSRCGEMPRPGGQSGRSPSRGFA